MYTLTGMTRRHLLIIALGIWAALFALSFVLLFTLEPTGEGFVRGLNRVTAFVGWQGAAFVAAIVALVAGRGSNATGGLRWLSRVPAIVQALMLLLLIGVILATRFTQPPAEPYVPPGPVTAPAPTAALPAEPPAEVRQFDGIFRSGFEASHFYTMDGQGPWWLEANDADWQRINESYVDGPGRAGGVTVAMSVSGWLEEIGDELAHVGIDGYRLHVESIEGMRVLSEEEFELVLQTVRRR